MLAELGRRAERARIGRDLSQLDVARLAGVGKRTVERFEAGESTTTVNLVRIARALELLPGLVEVFPAPVASPLAQLRDERRERRRASPRRSGRGPASGVAAAQPPDATPTEPRPFRWGDEDGPT